MAAGPRLEKSGVGGFRTDAADAAAICEAVTRPTMRFVPVKSREQQAALSMHRTRALLVKQRTQLVNMIRGLLAEFGIDIPLGLDRALTMARQIAEGEGVPDLPNAAAKMVAILSRQALDTHGQLREIDRDLAALSRSDEIACRLATIPGIGPSGATAFAAAVTDPGQFRSGRKFTARLGLTPFQKCTPRLFQHPAGHPLDPTFRHPKPGPQPTLLVPEVESTLRNGLAGRRPST